jgi:hypothetical protein
MRNVTANARFWVVGILVALGGVGLARAIAPLSAGHLRVALTVGGQLLALGGLLIISVGVSRRVRAPAAAPADAAGPARAAGPRLSP